MGISKAHRSAKRRPVYINGVYCESVTAGAKEASRILGLEVPAWKMYRVADGKLKITGVEISIIPPQRKGPGGKSLLKTRNYGEPLMRYPPGESPLDWGLPPSWR